VNWGQIKRRGRVMSPISHRYTDEFQVIDEPPLSGE
jgi:hypothetical protein